LATRLNPDRDFLLTADGISTDLYIRHIASRFGFSILAVKPWAGQASSKAVQDFWNSKNSSINNLTDIQQPKPTIPLGDSGCPEYRAYYLQLQEPLSDMACIDSRLPTISSPDAEFDRDQLLIQIASECFLLSVRPKGKIHHAALNRLAKAQPEIRPACERTWILVSALTKPAVQSNLEQAGAVGWWLYDQHPLDRDRSDLDSQETQVDAAPPPLASSVHRPSAWAPILRLDEFPAERFLIHWTRYRVGPWPEQTQEEWLDDLLFQSDRRKHGPAFALRRILATRQILASRGLTRDDQPVVCLSNRSLADLDNLTVFRQHLGRWDFVPFGIAIEREWLFHQGARPVIYGDESVWTSLPDSERPFFQLAHSKSGKVDWTIEQEWRWLGNLNLRRIPAACVAAFVPELTDAQKLTPICGCPIVVIDAKDRGSTSI
jgi:hypothetical protein